MTNRLLVLCVVLFAAAGVAARANRAEDVPIRNSLRELPQQIGEWRGRDTGRFTAAIERQLQADDYVNRVYTRPDAPSVSLYVGYHASQRQGTAIHSPLNCLPGAGWQPVGKSTIEIPVAGRGTILVNRYVIEKGLDRQVVLYWYESHGRAIASEYSAKAFMVYDAVRLNRTDAALVRVGSPVLDTEPDDSAATARTIRFVQALFPLLGTHLPS